MLFRSPIPLLWQHKPDEPIGQVLNATVTDSGIRITAKLAKGVQRIDEAWQLIKSGLVRGLSIGFRPLDVQPMKGGGMHFVAWDWFELSAVTVPANADCSIAVVKQFATSSEPFHSAGTGVSV